jgi:hypothetical protein
MEQQMQFNFESSVLNFSTSAACPENVYVHGNYNPILKNLLPVTVANSLPPLDKNIIFLLS